MRQAARPDARLAAAVDLVRDAGAELRRQPVPSGAGWKRPGERVTAMDLALQARMIERLSERFPADGILAEESVRGVRLGAEFVWVIDPLDGTNNYVLGIPCFAVSLGVLREGRPHAGVIHDPNTGFMCTAVHGGGAFAGETRLAASARALTADSNVCVRAPVSPSLRRFVADWLGRHKLRGFGSVALQLAYVALGAIDLVVDDRAALWDVVAGAAIVLEAGGRITDLTGASLFPFDPARADAPAVPFVAGSVDAHAKALADLRAGIEAEGVVKDEHHG